MAFPSSSSSPIRRYHVFPSFHGPDVRKGFLSHFHYHFASKGIRTFKDQKIERGHTIGTELYASSSWCLDELVEILKCKEAQGQIVMTIFYEVDPSDVRKQSGDFGSAFEKTCQGKTEEVKLRWSKALNHVANIAGEHSLNWDNEAEMIQKIATDVSNKLNVTPSMDFEGMVGLEAHLTKLNSLLCPEDDQVKMIGLWGPAGIGKTTIAEALFDQLSSSFQLKCFMENLKGMGVDDNHSKLSLQKKLMSKILNQGDMRVDHLGAIKEWLQDQRVLIILDDVDDLEQLKVLAKELSWFGSGSRIIVTTEDKKILTAHRIQDIYHVDFPSKEEALEILCRYAFKQSSVPYGFEELANKVAEFCGNLPLGLRVVGSSLCEESKHGWELQLSRIEASLDGKIEKVLKVGYDRLSKKDQSLFLHIACFFNNEDVGHVISVLSDSNLDVEYSLKILADKSLVHISTNGDIVMHHLLQQLGRQIVLEQSDDPGKRQFLIEAEEIRDVLTNATGTGSVIGISFDPSDLGEVSVSKGAFEGMRNLRFLRIRFGDGKYNLKIPKDMKYLPPLRLVHWGNYPRKSLPSEFQPKHLVELHMSSSKLEKLWGGIQPLPNLKSIDLSNCDRLKEIPNLSNATNLETLELVLCFSLVELPTSISNLHKLRKLNMRICPNLRVIPTNINLASLEEVDMGYCEQLRRFPDFSTNIQKIDVGNTKIEDVPPSVARDWSRLECLVIGSRSLKRLTRAPQSITSLDLSYSYIKRIPDCVTSLPLLVALIVQNCPKLETVLALPPSLKSLTADNSVSLQRVCVSFHNPTKILRFCNCLRLDEDTRRGIIQQSISDHICLPGKNIPAEFTHRTTGESITIPLAPGTLSTSSRFKACFRILSTLGNDRWHYISCSLRSKGGVTVNSRKWTWNSEMASGSEHLFIIHGYLFRQRNRCHEVDVTLSEIKFKFSSDWPEADKIIECGVQIMTEEAEGNSSELDNFETESIGTEVDNFEMESIGMEVDNYEPESSSSEVDKYETEGSSSEVGYYETGGDDNHHIDRDGDYEAEGLSFSQVENIKTSKHTGFRSWLRKLWLKEKKMNTTERNTCGVS